MRKNFLNHIVLAAMLFVMTLGVGPESYAGIHIKLDSVSKGGIDEINFITTGTTAQQVGTEFQIPIINNTLIAAGVANGGATSMATSELAVPVTFSYVRKAIASDPAFSAGTLANGTPGQTLTIFITSVAGSGTFVLTPTTKTGFTTITFNTAKQSATLLFVNTTIGWVVTGTGSSAATNDPTVAIP